MERPSRYMPFLRRLDSTASGVEADALVINVVVTGTFTASVNTSADALSLAR